MEIKCCNPSFQVFSLQRGVYGKAELNKPLPTSTVEDIVKIRIKVSLGVQCKQKYKNFLKSPIPIIC